MSINSEKQDGSPAEKKNGRTGKIGNNGKIAGHIGPDHSATSDSGVSRMLEFQQNSGETQAGNDSLADQARTSAYNEALKVNESLNESAIQADKVQWNLVAAMLRVGEYLLSDAGELDITKLDAFLLRHNIKRHKNTREDWRYVAKACVPEQTPQDRITLYGYVLTTMIAQGLGSQNALHEFQTGAQVGDRHRVGLNRFVLQHKAHKKALVAAANGAKDTNKYVGMAKPRLLKEAILLLSALETAGVRVPGMADVVKAIADVEATAQQGVSAK